MCILFINRNISSICYIKIKKDDFLLIQNKPSPIINILPFLHLF
ncbi:hypothetical protein VII00023_19399 [Vibrio ichthyoenteri ATCC 700023]|uniref:Uncharacterized protein n=1 Tax=Vibrio ichthyoenteri ATCC 700023 TaxID=870968 RepID=F9S3B0_9VIBR|nr:hypothetical protein VII00023_19399 [Vibrio ichthyoenteri ATCC 700023]